MLAVYNSLGWFLGIFAMLVGGLGMMNAMLMSVFERTQAIEERWDELSVARLFSRDPTDGQMLPTAYTAANLVEILVLVLGAIGGRYLAWRAANLRPVDMSV